MITSGIDLAAQPRATGLCTLQWGEGAKCVELFVGAEDEALVAAAVSADHTGIDAPFGWPDAFVAAVSAHHDGSMGGAFPPDTEDLRLRATDLWVWRTFGKRPMSVSTDRIGVTAMRCGRLQHLVAAETGEPVDRIGRRRLAEVYPAAALKQWGLPSSGYKRRDVASRALREAIVAAVRDRFDLRLTSQHLKLAQENDNALDALLSAVVVRLVALGATGGPPPELARRAAREGWIHVPTG